MTLRRWAPSAVFNGLTRCTVAATMSFLGQGTAGYFELYELKFSTYSKRLCAAFVDVTNRLVFDSRRHTFHGRPWNPVKSKTAPIHSNATASPPAISSMPKKGSSEPCTALTNGA